MSDERRRAERYPLHLPVELGDTGGLTRDMSISGVYFETSRSMQVGSVVRFAVVLERGGAPAEPIRINCSGRIIRVDEDVARVGIAATIDQLEIAQQDPANAFVDSKKKEGLV